MPIIPKKASRIFKEAKNDSLRVLRGGCWRNEPVYCRSASRYKPPRPVAASAAASASRLPSDKSRTVYRHQRSVPAIAVPTSFDASMLVDLSPPPPRPAAGDSAVAQPTSTPLTGPRFTDYRFIR